VPDPATTAPTPGVAADRPATGAALRVTVEDCHPDRCAIARLVDEVAAAGFGQEAVVTAAVAACDEENGCWLARQAITSSVQALAAPGSSPRMGVVARSTARRASA
jgi:hypothetical protein